MLRQPPLPPTYRVLPGSATRHDAVCPRHDVTSAERINGRLDLTITTIDPLHIGRGVTSVWDLGPKGRVLVRDCMVMRVGDDDVPVIPGASIKGAVRNLFEALAGGCGLDGRDCDPPCLACAVFGQIRRSGGYMGRVGFDDALPQDLAEASQRMGVTYGPVAYAPRKPLGRRIYKQSARDTRQEVPYVVVDPGFVFRTVVHLANLTPRELGSLLLAMGMDGSFRLRIGGGKFAGFGRVRFDAAGGWLRKGYAPPARQDLDTAAAKKLVVESIEQAALAEDGKKVLEGLRGTLGGNT